MAWENRDCGAYLHYSPLLVRGNQNELGGPPLAHCIALQLCVLWLLQGVPLWLVSPVGLHL